MQLGYGGIYPSNPLLQLKALQTGVRWVYKKKLLKTTAVQASFDNRLESTNIIYDALQQTPQPGGLLIVDNTIRI